MFKNYLNTALRNIYKRKIFAFLNIIGLAIGIAGYLFIFRYVQYEKSYDAFNPDADRIVRINMDVFQGNTLELQSALTFPAVVPALQRELPEIENFCRLSRANVLLHNELNDIRSSEREGFFADTSVFTFFSTHLIKGDKASSLRGPDKIVLSESLAKKYFGNPDPIGKFLLARDPNMTQAYEVTGVFKDYPSDSHLKAHYFISMPTLFKYFQTRGDTTGRTENSWDWMNFYSYVKLGMDASEGQLETPLKTFSNRYLNKQSTDMGKLELSAMPILDIHLQSKLYSEISAGGDNKTVSTLSLVGFLMICIAWINFITLSTANAINRAREVGVRKILGASRLDAVKQFFLESTLINFAGLFFGVLILFMFSKPLGITLGLNMPNEFNLSPYEWMLFASFFLGGIVLSGLYPALVLSGYQPVKILKGLFRSSEKGLMLRKALTVLQFSSAVMLIASTLIIYSQVDFMRNHDPGMNLEQTLVLTGPEADPDSIFTRKANAFKNDVLALNGIRNFATSNNVMGRDFFWSVQASRKENAGQQRATLFRVDIDDHYIPLFELEVLAGRNFSADFGGEEKSIIINESALRVLDINTPAEAVDQVLIVDQDTLNIKGVVKNYHHLGLQQNIDPIMLLYRPHSRRLYSLKMETANAPDLITSLEKTWNAYFPGDPFNYFFLDDRYQQQYKSEQNFGKVMGTFSLLAVCIACLGLFGLSVYAIVQRLKEISIRKVMGAHLTHLLFILSKDFLLLVVISFLLAVPVIWYTMTQWLDNFAYHVSIPWRVFLFTGIAVFTFAAAVISVQVIKAAFQNPLDNLRNE
jgi:putative ABC transport system permease protein